MERTHLDPRRWQALFLLCAAQFISGGPTSAGSLECWLQTAFMGAAVIAVGAAAVAALAIRSPRQAENAETADVKAA